jgi:hypothetical protein
MLRSLATRALRTALPARLLRLPPGPVPPSWRVCAAAGLTVVVSASVAAAEALPPTPQRTLYPECEPYKTGTLVVGSGLHTLRWEEVRSLCSRWKVVRLLD